MPSFNKKRLKNFQTYFLMAYCCASPFCFLPQQIVRFKCIVDRHVFHLNKPSKQLRWKQYIRLMCDVYECATIHLINNLIRISYSNGTIVILSIKYISLIVSLLYITVTFEPAPTNVNAQLISETYINRHTPSVLATVCTSKSDTANVSAYENTHTQLMNASYTNHIRCGMFGWNIKLFLVLVLNVMQYPCGQISCQCQCHVCNVRVSLRWPLF